MKRCFVVGNGASLNNTPLELLNDEICFSVNRIHLLFPHTKWRPQYHVRSEPMLGTGLFEYQLAEELMAIWKLNIPCYLSQGIKGVITRRGLQGFERNTTYFMNCEHFQKNWNDDNIPEYWHPPTLCSYGTAVHVAMQIADNMGFEEIYLVGCDIGYQEGKQNHFSDRYDLGRLNVERANNNALSAHEIAKRSSKAKIFNATISGELEIYPRINIFDMKTKG